MLRDVAVDGVGEGEEGEQQREEGECETHGARRVRRDEK
jgi:hypothetical protein